MVPTLPRVILLALLLFNWIGGDWAHVHAGKITTAQPIAHIGKPFGVDQPDRVQRAASILATMSRAHRRRGH